VVTGELSIGCGHCAAVCPEEAITFTRDQIFHSDIKAAAGVFSDAVKQFATIIGSDDISKKKLSKAIQSMKKQGSGDSPKHHVVQPWDIKE